jgi:hypothetical protein
VEQCSFHFVPHFEEQLPAVNVNSEFIFSGLDATFPILTVAGLVSPMDRAIT